MSETVLSKTKQFLQVAPYILWAVMNLSLILILSYKRDLIFALHYSIAFFGFGSLVIWYFGYKLFPEFLKKEGKFDSKLIGQLCIGIFIFIVGIAAHYLLPKILGINRLEDDKKIPVLLRLIVWLMMVFLGVIVMISVRIANAYHKLELNKIGQLADRAKTELTLLKTQISPHFLFNTLNNIYGLAYLGDERAAKMISKLSLIMRYLLDDCEQPRVQLVKERDLLDDYLSLQLLKHEGGRNVDFYHDGVNHTHSFVPMVLINFIENCFKHSDIETNPESWIRISMEVENNELIFRTVNSIKKEIKDRSNDRKGIGLTNALKLLEANYPNRHKVKIDKTDKEYKFELIVQL